MNCCSEKRNNMLYLVIETSKMLITQCRSPLSVEQFPNDGRALIRSLVIPTILGNCARWIKFNLGYFFPCSSEIFLRISLKIRTKVLPHPSWNELTSSRTNSTPQWYLHRHDHHHNLPHLASGSPTQHTLVDCQQQLTRSRQQHKNNISWLTIINPPSLKPSSYEIISHPLITNALDEQRAQFFYSASH